jgi:hypothetical protein
MSNNKQSSVEKEFVPYAEALALKQLGFDEPCIAWYAENKELQIAPDTYKKWSSKACNNSNIISVFNSDCITAPTYSQAFRWFREKHNLHSGISVHTLLDENDEDRDEYYFSIRKLKPVEVIYSGDFMLEYSDSELACLRKLIEIIKEHKGGEQC